MPPKISDEDLDNVAFNRLVEALRRRSSAAFIACILKEGSPESRIRVSQHSAGGKSDLELLGLATLCQSDVLAGVKAHMLGEDR